jgi:hypothetical protein
VLRKKKFFVTRKRICRETKRAPHPPPVPPKRRANVLAHFNLPWSVLQQAL